jgi:hypothetical protein
MKEQLNDDYAVSTAAVATGYRRLQAEVSANAEKAARPLT